MKILTILIFVLIVFALVWTSKFSFVPAIPIGGIYQEGQKDIKLPSVAIVIPCDGRSLAVQNFPQLFEIVKYQHGGRGPVFQIPNIGGKFMIRIK